MKYISPIISDARGSLGGTTFARNRAGVYTRARVAPTQPRTNSQQENRAAFATLTQSWRTLTQEQIAGWNTLAIGVTLTDTLGKNYTPSGMQLYISCNRNLTNIGRSTISEPPPQRQITQDMTSSTILLGTTNGIWTACEIIYPGPPQDAYPNFLVQMSAPLSPGVSFIAAHLYRNMHPPFAVGGGIIGMNTPYANQFGVPPPGVLIGTKLTSIDVNYGWAGPTAYFRNIVTS